MAPKDKITLQTAPVGKYRCFKAGTFRGTIEVLGFYHDGKIDKPVLILKEKAGDPTDPNKVNLTLRAVVGAKQESEGVWSNEGVKVSRYAWVSREISGSALKGSPGNLDDAVTVKRGPRNKDGVPSARNNPNRLELTSPEDVALLDEWREAYGDTTFQDAFLPMIRDALKEAVKEKETVLALQRLMNSFTLGRISLQEFNRQSQALQTKMEKAEKTAVAS